MEERDAEQIHLSVLPHETIEFLDIARGGVFIDATLGMGGHAEAILSGNDDTRLVGIDRDPAALAIAGKRLERFGNRFTPVHGNFRDITEVVSQIGLGQVNGIVADLGLSSLQLDTPERGFSFRFDAPLDMRMDPTADTETAADILATYEEKEIADLIYQLGEERVSRRIAKWIVERRDRGEPITTTTELAKLVERAVGKKPKDRIHPATRTFQALRIAVNGEIEILENFMADAVGLLSSGGRIAVITFHSLEDKVIKRSMQKLAGRCFCPPRIPQCICGVTKTINILTKKPVTASEAETNENPRSRSAKLRAAEKI